MGHFVLSGPQGGGSPYTWNTTGVVEGEFEIIFALQNGPLLTDTHTHTLTHSDGSDSMTSTADEGGKYSPLVSCVSM